MPTKIALITGASRGLGRNAALHLARAGTDVVLTYHRGQADATRVVEEIRGHGRKAEALQLDVGQTSTFKDFAARLIKSLRQTWDRDRFDILVNNAGIGISKPFMETTEADFDELMNIHFKGTFFITQTLLPILNDGGRIINLSSGLARMTLPGYSAYASMKGGIEVLTRYLTKELGPRRITVNVIAPGAIETDFGGGRVRDNAELNKMIASQTALGRVGLPDDIGSAITAMVSDELDWMTAQRVEVSGGQNL